ncbi:MAG: potassium-transporting ATPase subunit KdpA, partial [Polyangiaceae bacterium]
MSTHDVAQIALFLLVLVALAKPLGTYMARVYEGEATFISKVIGPIERLILRAIGSDPKEEMKWTTYAGAMLAFNAVGLLFVYLLQRLQGSLPLNPQALGAVEPSLAFNTATSFATNTNWQSYAGETTLGYLVQMLGLTVQNFVSAAS